ncbi:HEPN domain-containing protein [Halocella sp. SP3-1]|uniref:HEPN domain-containing protein n=1 Tax=Halocella sp. SP3-1 TaxID=2382161 RepID=UPI0013E026B4|nr:HEPN domain-containing protein [Halocella sp. SP3-1]
MDKKLDLVKEWIHKAGNDLGMAKLALDNQVEYTDAICFHCQQAVEKYLKAYLIDQDIVFKRSHSISYLLDLMDDIENVSESLYQKAEILESYAVEIRYPDNWYEPTKEETAEAYNIAVEFKKYILDRVIIE